MKGKHWVRLLPTNALAPGAAKYVEAGGLELAAFHLSDPDRFVVTANSCPHAGGNLAAGQVEGREVTCPWHCWKFDLDNGRCTLSETVQLRRYEARVEGGFIWARLDQPLPPGPPNAEGPS
ncbi:Assimilatory nitrite reductase [NAD(P)H] small subunit [Phycisphaerae bacterium RAS2]|nr:Assimilatory nitrite reductase [NAD(P)H] small subunit [Phycisphaerae bacterium RAS2]